MIRARIHTARNTVVDNLMRSGTSWGDTLRARRRALQQDPERNLPARRAFNAELRAFRARHPGERR